MKKDKRYTSVQENTTQSTKDLATRRTPLKAERGQNTIWQFRNLSVIINAIFQSLVWNLEYFKYPTFALICTIERDTVCSRNQFLLIP